MEFIPFMHSELFCNKIRSRRRPEDVTTLKHLYAPARPIRALANLSFSKPLGHLASKASKCISFGYRMNNTCRMYAINQLGSSMGDASEAKDLKDYGTLRRNSLPENLDDVFPKAKWTRAIQDERKRQFPQAIAHRGYKAIYPENTMKAFQGAVEAGTHALETDIHLSKDGVVVLSHDKDLKRCFGRTETIIDCDWQFLSEQRTLKEPHEPMPKLADLLEYLGRPEQQHIWLLLDIKVDNNADDVMRLIAETIKSVDSGPRPWNQRIVLGIWVPRYLPLCVQYLPGYPISHIGFATFYARQFLKVPNVSFNMLQKVLIGPIGARFIRDVKKAGRPIYAWTVNDANLMKWCIQKELDGVITDDPKLFRQICDTWSDKEPVAKLSWFQWFYTFYLYILLSVFWFPFRRKFPETVDMFLKTNGAKSKRPGGPEQ